MSFWEHKDIEAALNYRGLKQIELFKEATAVANHKFENRVLVRGVIEITNICRINCDYCPMRRDNTRMNSTYTLSVEEIVDVSREIRDSGINIVFLQGGEISQTTRIVAEAIPQIREVFSDKVEILLCLGNKSKEEYALLYELGARSYIIKHETSDKELHEQVRHDSYEERIKCIEDLLSIGYRVGIGTIVGLPGQSLKSISDDVLLVRKLGVHMASASPLIPAPNTPFADQPTGSIDLTLNLIALLRINYPHLLIPSVSALEKIQKGGQQKGLEVGANVVTINFTPSLQQTKYLIYGEQRHIVRREYVESLLQQLNREADTSYWV